MVLTVNNNETLWLNSESEMKMEGKNKGKKGTKKKGYLLKRHTLHT